MFLLLKNNHHHPSIRDAVKMGVRIEKNVAITVPKKPKRNIVDDRFGDKFAVDPSGLTPKYIFKKVTILLLIDYLFY